jgi:hypothetical protein
MGEPSTVGLGFETPFVDLWTVRDYPGLPGSRIGFRAFSKSLRGQLQPFERHPKIHRNRTLVPPGAGVSLSGEDWITMAMSGASRSAKDVPEAPAALLR